MKRKGFVVEVFIVCLVLILCPLIVADLGLSSDYHSENPIKIDLGEVREIVIGRFINTGNETVNLIVELVEGFEIAEVLDEKVVVPVNGKEGLRIKISVPENVSRGESHFVRIKYTETGSGDEGMIVIATSNTVSIPVLIQEGDVVSEVKGISKKTIIWIILGILVVIILIVVVKFVLKEKEAFSESAI